MMRRLLHSHKGATIVEFALIAPLFCTMVLAILQMGLAFQRWNAAQATARTTARCLAIASPRCTAPLSGGGDPAIAYALAVAGTNGVGSVTADMVAVGTTTGNGVTYRQVTLRVPASILGQTVLLRASDRFPQP